MQIIAYLFLGYFWLVGDEDLVDNKGFLRHRWGLWLRLTNSHRWGLRLRLTNSHRWGLQKADQKFKFGFVLILGLVSAKILSFGQKYQ